MSIRKTLHKFLIDNAYLASQSNSALEYYFELPSSSEIPAVITEVLSRKRDFCRECHIETWILPESPDTRRFNVKIRGGWLYGWGDTGRPFEKYLEEYVLLKEESL